MIVVVDDAGEASRRKEVNNVEWKILLLMNVSLSNANPLCMAISQPRAPWRPGVANFSAHWHISYVGAITLLVPT